MIPAGMGSAACASYTRHRGLFLRVGRGGEAGGGPAGGGLGGPLGDLLGGVSGGGLGGEKIGQKYKAFHENGRRPLFRGSGRWGPGRVKIKGKA